MIDRYAVIGNPVAHSKSPLIHAAFAQATTQAMTYERLLAPVDAFNAVVAHFVAHGGVGLNVTTPFKIDAFALAREKSTRSLDAEACNTLAWRGDHWYADNTDGAGLVRDITHNHSERLTGRDVLLLGAGGAARGIVGPLLEQRPRKLVIVNRTHARAVALVARFSGKGDISAPDARAVAGERFDVVINATSAGQVGSPGKGEWPAVMFARDAFAYDLIYADRPTAFLQWAKRAGATRLADGLGMLIEQAAESFVLWRGVRPSTTPVFALLRPAGPR